MSVEGQPIDVDALQASLATKDEEIGTLRKVMENPEKWMKWCDIKMIEQIEQLQAENDSLKKTNQSLNRRCQQAESACNTTIDDCRREGISLGRSLAGVGHNVLLAENISLHTGIKRLKEALTEASHMIYGELYPDHPTYMKVEQALKEGE